MTQSRNLDNNTAQHITYQELIQAVADASDSDTRYGFFLGAGASVESGIPVAKALSEKWLRTIKNNKGANNRELKKWEEEPAKYYSEIFSQRFRANASAGHDELQGYINRATPSIGYLFLAQILTNTKHKFVLTTNFDTMTEDALFSLQNTKPLIIGHTSLANYISVNNSIRPVIVKLHHDYLLSPKHTTKDTDALTPELKKNLDPVLAGVHLIVIGYGGYDTDIMNYLRETTSRKPIYWCCRDERKLSAEIKSLLTDQDFIVEIEGFDLFMLMLNAKLEHSPLIDPDDVEESVLVKNAIQQAKKYQEQLKKLGKQDIEDDELEALKVQLPTWWDYELQVKKETDPSKQNKIYQEGLKAHPKSFELFGNYALFLTNIRKNHDQAEAYYKKSLELEPDDENANNNYASFLMNIRKDYDQAKKHYKKSLESKPNNATFNGNYANLLKGIRKNYDQAEKHYKKALKTEPDHANNNGNYAQFLFIKGEESQAQVYLDKAFNFADNHQDLLAELWFYRLAHCPDYRQQAIKQLDALLEMGVKSIGWDFSANIERAKEQGFEPIELLQQYADKISQ